MLDNMIVNISQLIFIDCCVQNCIGNLRERCSKSLTEQLKCGGQADGLGEVRDSESRQAFWARLGHSLPF